VVSTENEIKPITNVLDCFYYAATCNINTHTQTHTDNASLHKTRHKQHVR